MRDRSQSAGASDIGGMAIWPATPDELTQLQQTLGELTQEHWQPPTTVLRIGASFV